MTTKKRLGTVFFYGVAILLAVIALIPFLWMISTSFKSRGALMSIPIEWIPENPTWDAYIKVFSKFPFAKTIANSLFISVSYTAITLLSSAMAAFAFAKLRFTGSRVIFGGYLATMMIPTQVTMIPLFVIMTKLGLKDSCWCSRCEPSRRTSWLLPGLTAPGCSRCSGRLPCLCVFPALPPCPSLPSWSPGMTICGRC